MAIFLCFGIFKKIGKWEADRKGHEASTRVEGAPPASWAPRVLSGLRFLARYFFWSVKIHYIISRRFWPPYHANILCSRFELFSVRVVKARHHVVPLLQQWWQRCLANEDRAEEGRTKEINKDEGIKKATEDQAPEDNLQLDHNLLTPTEIEAFKMIELARIQNKYLTHENILLKEHIIALKGIIRKLEDLLRSMCDYPSSPPSSSPTKEI